MKLFDKIALVIDDGSRFGRASSTLFAQEEAKISIVDLNAEETSCAPHSRRHR